MILVLDEEKSKELKKDLEFIFRRLGAWEEETAIMLVYNALE